MMRRHPSPEALGAWFDGEDAEGVEAHVAGCERCFRRVQELRRVRCALRGEPLPVGLHRSVGFRPVAAGLALVILLVVASVVVPTVSRTIGDDSPSRAEETGGGRSEPAPTSPPDAAFSGAAADMAAGAVAPPAAPALEASSKLPVRLGVVVPTTGPAAAEGAEVVRAVRQAAAAANASGGVGGRPVQVVAARAENRSAMMGLVNRVDALVGGFGTSPPPGLDWILPADPDVSGPGVVPAEVSPRAAGTLLSLHLESQRLLGTVGVVVGQGVEVALGDGLWDEGRPLLRLPGQEGSCTGATLELGGPIALAIAGPPPLVARCARAVEGSTWRPRGGLLLPPSAAYAGRLVEDTVGAYTVLGFPWPTSDVPAAARFRRAVPGATSYRALVSFAAAELAILVARSQGEVSAGAVSRGVWRTDLLHFQGVVNRGATVVAAVPGGWAVQPGRKR
jgi:Periplasmic binding protein